MNISNATAALGYIPIDQDPALPMFRAILIVYLVVNCINLPFTTVQFLLDVKNPRRPGLGSVQRTMHKTVFAVVFFGFVHLVLMVIEPQGMPRAIAWICYDNIVCLILRAFHQFTGFLLSAQLASSKDGLPKSFIFVGAFLQISLFIAMLASTILVFALNETKYRAIVTAFTVLNFTILGGNIAKISYDLIKMKATMDRAASSNKTETQLKKAAKAALNFKLQIAVLLGLCAVIAILYLRGLLRYVSSTDPWVFPGLDVSAQRTTIMLANFLVLIGVSGFNKQYWVAIRPPKKTSSKTKSSKTSKAPKSKKSKSSKVRPDEV